MNTMSNLSGRLCRVGAALWLGVSAAAMAQQPSGETPPAPVPVAPVAPVAARPTKPATHSNAQLDAGEPRAETSPAGAEPSSSTAVGRVEPRHAAGSVGGAKTGVDRALEEGGHRRQFRQAHEQFVGRSVGARRSG